MVLQPTLMTLNRMLSALVVLSLWPAMLAPQGSDVPVLSGTWHTLVELRRAVPTAPLEPHEVLGRASAELAVGGAARARALLEAQPLPRSSPLWGTAVRLLAMAEDATGNYERAGRLFAAAAERAAGGRRGVLEGQAAVAFERAGLPRPAARHYRRAARYLPEVAGWLAVREARLLADTARVTEALRRASAVEPRLVARARSAALLRAGEVLGAEGALVAAGLEAEAAELALLRDDASLARQLVYQAMARRDTITELAVVRRVLGAVPPETADDIQTAAEFFRRQRAPREALAVLSRGVEAGHASAEALLLLGQVHEDLGARAAALAAYDRAASLEGDAAARAAYARARVLVRLRGVRAGGPALVRFAAAFPEHGSAPAALLVAANAHAQAGQWVAAESLYEEVVARWPAHAVAADARLRLADRAIERRNLPRAEALYREVAERRGADGVAARYRLGRVRLALGDTAEARSVWTALARDDSLGYYGLLAREAVGLPDPVFEPVERAAATSDVQRALAEFNALHALGFETESRMLVASLVPQWDAFRLLTFAETLLGGPRTFLAVSLGWRASSELTLNDPRVLRVVFPWPWRELIEAEARKFDLDPYLLAALIRQESTFRPAVVSRAGATGLMQLMPGTAAQTAGRLGVEWTDGMLTVPDANVHVGAAHLAGLLRRYRGDVILALAAYNAGGRPVDRWRRLPGAGDPFLFVDRIPYPETRGYVRGVVRDRALYRALYPGVSVQ